jgi:hypothetical protein
VIHQGRVTTSAGSKAATSAIAKIAAVGQKISPQEDSSDEAKNPIEQAQKKGLLTQ